MNTSDRLQYWTSAAALVYVLAWLSGLAVAPTGPGINAAADQVHAHYLGHGGSVLIQALLVHGAAGLALAAMAVGTARASTAPHPLRATVTISGLAAAALSIGQAAIAATATQSAAGATAEHSLALFHAIDYTDSIKLILLAAFVAAATAARHATKPTAPWIRLAAILLVPLLISGAAAFLAPSAMLNTLLAGSLILLLVWSAGLAWTHKPRRSILPAEKTAG